MGRKAPASIIHWRSRKLPKKAGPPQLVEMYARSYTVTEMAWIKSLWESMVWQDYNVLLQRRDSAAPRALAMPYVIRDENPWYTDPEAMLVMDSKGLHDALDNELPQDDRKSALETPIIHEILRRIGGRARWLPHNYNPSDAMTKFIGAHTKPLYDLLQTGTFTLRGELEELADRAEQKKLGSVPRLKVNANSMKKTGSAPRLKVDKENLANHQNISGPHLKEMFGDPKRQNATPRLVNWSTSTNLSMDSGQASIAVTALPVLVSRAPEFFVSAVKSAFNHMANVSWG